MKNINKIREIFRSENNKVSDLNDYIELIKSEDIIIDCGANVGNIIYPFAEIGCRIYAFEPNPYAYQKLQNKFKKYDHIYCITKAISTVNSTARLYFHENSNNDEYYWSTGSSLLKYKNNVMKNKYISVETINFSEFIKSLNQTVKIIKMDIEGAEIDVINQLINDETYKLIGQLFVETHEKKIPELFTKTNLLRKRLKDLKIDNINLNWV